MPTTQIRGRQILNKDIAGEDLADDLIVNENGSTGSFTIAGDVNKILFAATSASGTVVIAGNVPTSEIDSLNLSSGDIFVSGSHITITGSAVDFKGNSIFFNGLSGSLTRLSDGTSFIVAGPGITVVTGSNGAITLKTNQPDSVVDIAALKLLDDDQYPDGTNCNVITLLDAFYLNKNSSITADDIAVTTTKSGTGRWIRLNLGNKQWANQSTWYVNSTTGSDEAAGNSIAPIKTLAEWYRRIGKCEIDTSTTIYLMNDLTDASAINGNIVITKNGSITISGEKAITPIFSGSFTSVTTIDPASNQPWEVTDTSLSSSSYWASFVTSSPGADGYRIRIDGGPRNNAIAWIAKNLGSKTARISQPLNVNESTPYLSSMTSIQVSDNYVIEKIPALPGFSLNIRSPATNAGALKIKDIAIKQVTGGVSAEPGGYNLVMTNSSFPYSQNFLVINCDTRIIPNGAQTFVNCRFTRLNQALYPASSTTILGGMFIGPSSYTHPTSVAYLGNFYIDFRFMIQRGGLFIAGSPDINRAYVCSFQAYDNPGLHGLTLVQGSNAAILSGLGNKEFFGSGHAEQAIRVYKGGRLFYVTDVTGLTMTGNGNPILLGASAVGNTRTYSDLPLTEINKETINGVPRVTGHTYFVKAN